MVYFPIRKNCQTDEMILVKVILSIDLLNWMYPQAFINNKNKSKIKQNQKTNENFVTLS